MPEQTSDSAAPRDWQRHTIVILAVLALAHSVIILLWLAPSGPLRSAAGEQRLGSYVDPYFRQSWDTLTPSAQRVDEAFRIRARLRSTSDQKVEVTGWIDVTEQDLRNASKPFATPRTFDAARRLATNLNSAMFDLSSDGRKVVKRNVVDSKLHELERDLAASGSEPAAVRNYLNNNAMATKFASLYAHAVWGERVSSVQYLVGRRTVSSFAERRGPKVSEQDFLWFEFGWRTAFRGTEEARAAFKSYVKK